LASKGLSHVQKWRYGFSISKPGGAIMRVLVVIIIAGGLGGCGLAAKVEARQDYRSSVAAYKECLATHAPNQCEGLRLAMEADERQYNNLSAGITPGGQRSANINIQNR
jgi:hypothetical protein